MGCTIRVQARTYDPLLEVIQMSFSEALVQAHSTEATKAALVKDVLELLSLWDTIESLPEGSTAQRKSTEQAQVLVSKLRDAWQLTNKEIGDLDEYIDEFRSVFGTQLRQVTHQEAC